MGGLHCRKPDHMDRTRVVRHGPGNMPYGQGLTKCVSNCRCIRKCNLLRFVKGLFCNSQVYFPRRRTNEFICPIGNILGERRARRLIFLSYPTETVLTYMITIKMKKSTSVGIHFPWLNYILWLFLNLLPTGIVEPFFKVNTFAHTSVCEVTANIRQDWRRFQETVADDAVRSGVISGLESVKW